MIMAVTVETLDKLERKMTLTLPVNAIQSEVDSRLKKLARTVKMDGFRPGKVPLSVVAQRYGYSVQYEVMNDKVGEAFATAANEAKLRVAGQPPGPQGRLGAEGRQAGCRCPGVARDSRMFSTGRHIRVITAAVALLLVGGCESSTEPREIGQLPTEWAVAAATVEAATVAHEARAATASNTRRRWAGPARAPVERGSPLAARRRSGDPAQPGGHGGPLHDVHGADGGGRARVLRRADRGAAGRVGPHEARSRTRGAHDTAMRRGGVSS